MPTARRTFAHGPNGGWSAIAVHLEAAEPQKGGFTLTLFPDGRPPTAVFLRPQQLQQLCEMAASAQTTDQQLWEAVAKIPLEPLLPSRTLAARLRMLLVDQASAIREQVKAMIDRQPPPPPREPSSDSDGASPPPGFDRDPSSSSSM
jgi:hypothetical protein